MARKALLVGLNRYPDPANTLQGCVNDVRQIRALLEGHFDFSRPEDVRVLLDQQATTAAIRSGLAWLVAGARPGDVLVFHYSGHGSQVPDRDGDETTDSLDEIICPYDLDWDDPIADDDLYAAVRHLPAGVALTVVLDCCHSGTGLREPGGSGAVRPKFLTHPAAVPGTRGGSLRDRRKPLERRVRRIGRRAAAAGAVLVAGCRADQSSADAFIAGAYHGALSYFLCRALAESAYEVSYTRLVRRVRASLRAHGFEQDPQLEGPAALLQSDVFSPLPVAPCPSPSTRLARVRGGRCNG